jgi:hypothetical protein
MKEENLGEGSKSVKFKSKSRQEKKMMAKTLLDKLKKENLPKEETHPKIEEETKATG